MTDIQVSAFDAYDDDDRAAMLAELTSNLAEVGGDGFAPDTEDKAAWLTSRIAYHEAEAARIKDAMQREIKRHQSAADWLRERYSQALEAFARQAIDAAGGKRQKVLLPNGVALAFRRIPDGIAVQDEASVLAWATDNLPQALKVSLAKAPITAHWKDTGEIPPGCEALRDRIGFYIQA